MNLFNPQLLLTFQVAALVLVASALAAATAWLLARQRSAPLPVLDRLRLSGLDDSRRKTAMELEAAKSLNDELRRNLSATESQCLAALEQRDEAEQQAVQRSAEMRKLHDQLTELKSRETVPVEEHSRHLRLLEQQLREATSAAKTTEQKAADAATENGRLQQLLETLGQEKAAQEAAFTARIEALTTAAVPETLPAAAPTPEPPSLDKARQTLTRLEHELTVQEDILTRPDSGPAPSAAELKRQTAVQERLRRQVRALNRSIALLGNAPLQPDDLTQLKGIKAGINNQLQSFGIFTYAQIVQWDEEDMLAFNELLGFKNRIHRDKWQEQAQALLDRRTQSATLDLL